MVSNRLLFFSFVLTETGGRQRAANPANDERNRRFYQKLKESITDVEAVIQNERLPMTPDKILAQVQEFQRDITRHNRRTICQYCLIGRNLNTLKTRDFLTIARHTYSAGHIPFLTNLYKLSVFYPKIRQVTVGIRELKSNFKVVNTFR